MRSREIKVNIPPENDIEVKQYQKPSYRILDSSGQVIEARQLSRRDLGKLALGSIIVALTVAASVKALEKLPSLPKVEKETPEQKRAEELLSGLSENDKVRNLTAVGERVGDKFMPVAMRDRPSTPTVLLSAGKELGRLEHGVIISEAVVVWGNDPNDPENPAKKARWLAFRNSAKPESVVFSFGGLFFDEGNRINAVEPREVRG